MQENVPAGAVFQFVKNEGRGRWKALPARLVV